MGGLRIGLPSAVGPWLPKYGAAASRQLSGEQRQRRELIREGSL